MGDYRLEQLSPREFEHVVQALAINNLGVSSIIWGDGPDGGREATFEGSFRDLKTGLTASGLVVVQAKFLQRPHQTSAAQAAWALRQLQSEMAKYGDGGLKSPNAYIFATNAILPPTESGPKDRVLEELEAFRKRHGMSFAIAWDFDQIRSLLDNARDIRIRYSCLTTPGDVLYAALQELKTEEPSLDVVIPRVLQAELQRCSRGGLSALASVNGESVHLAQAFMDLPATRDRESYRNGLPAQDPNFGVLSGLLALEANTAPLVLLGGPGQGKTTVLQMMAQVHRAALLEGYDRTRLSPVTVPELDRIKVAINRLEVGYPSVVRLPLWVDARHLAAFHRCAPADQQSIWHYLAKTHQAIAKSPLSASAFRYLMQRQPAFIIIDGYDEASPTDRPRILQLVNEAVDEARLGGFDLAVVVSSRPQAYSDELRPNHFESWLLEPLSVEEARQYGRSLLAGISEDTDGALARFEHASTSTEIASLLSTPLHVSLVISLVLAAVELPRERFRLFQRYYDHVYERESERSEELNGFLTNNRPLVDELHRRVAFAIQLATERSRGAVGLSMDEFTALAKKCIDESPDVSSEDRDQLAGEILRYAKERLVLLVGVDSDSVGFQIKPLTDFLAAAHLLTTPNESLVRQRLRSVARLTQWRDVARFMGAASFDCRALIRRDLRDTVVLVLRELDDPSVVGIDALRRTGASLAAEILADSGLPPDDFYAGHLWPDATTAVELMQYPGFKQTLSRLQSFTADTSWLEEIRDLCLTVPEDGYLNRNAWELIAHVARAGNPTAKRYVKELLGRQDADGLAAALPSLDADEVSDVDEFPTYLAKSNPSAVMLSAIHADLRKAPAWAKTAWEFLHGGPRLDMYFQLAGFWPLSGAVTVQSGSWLAGLLTMPAPHHPNWDLWKDVSRLATSGAALSSLDQAIAKDPQALENWGTRGVVPWPVMEYLRTRTAGSDARHWRAAEARWRAQGVGLPDIESYIYNGALTPAIAEKGFPFSAIHWSASSSEHFDNLFRTAMDLWESSMPQDDRYKFIVAEKLLLPMFDHAAESSQEIVDPVALSRVARAAVRHTPTYAARDPFKRPHTTCNTATSALAGTQGDADFVNLAEHLISWGWSSGVDDAAPYAGAVVRRAVDLLKPTCFDKLCRKIAQRTSNVDTWNQLQHHWLGKSKDDSNILKRLLLLPRISLATRDDVRVAARTDIWALAEMLERYPGGHSPDVADFMAKLLIEAKHSAVVNSPIFAGARRTKFPQIGEILSDLGF